MKKNGGVNMQNEVIRSRQNRLVKLVCSLERKKGREETGLFRFDGIKLCNEALSKGVSLELFVAESRLDDIRSRLVKSDAPIVVVADDVFEKMSSEKAPEGVISVAKQLSELHSSASEDAVFDFRGEERIFMLEAIRDPGNLGTIIRTAASLGIDRLIISSDCADIYNPKTVRAAMGALFMLKTCTVDESDFCNCIKALRKNERRVFGAALCDGARELGSMELLPTDIFVVGNEGHGLSERTIDVCNECVIIPMREGCESLNAAMAAGILMWETVRS